MKIKKDWRENGRFTCRRCGASLTVQDNAKEYICDYCGTRQTFSLNYFDDDPVSLRSYLERGKLALDDHEWKKADAFFEKALNINPHSSEAYWGKFLVDNHLTEEMCLDGSFASGYDDLDSERSSANIVSDAHAKDMAKKYAIPFFLNADEIISKYEYKDEYSSRASVCQAQRARLAQEFRMDRMLSRALEFADSKTKQRIELCMRTMMHVMDLRVSLSLTEDGQRLDMLRTSYQNFLSQTDAMVIQMNIDAQRRRESIYQDCVASMQGNHTKSDWYRLQRRLEALGNYKNAPDLVEEIQIIIEREIQKEKTKTQALRSISSLVNTLFSYWKQIFIILLVIIYLISSIKNNLKYNEAVFYMNQEKYEDAISIFSDLGSYRDSNNKKKELEGIL